ncbi:MAG TPA: hypothetical protein VFH03_14925 [Actinoplanes sp.]|nr:hypothetical protein [Actinoplanes sp.]
MSVFRATNAATDNHDGSWSVPQQRPAYTDLYDGPTERLYESDTEPEPEERRQPRPRRGVTLAVVLAVLALIASAGAVWMAWRALAVAGTAPAAPSTPAAGSGPAPVAAPSQLAPGAEPELSAEATADPSAVPSAPDSGYAVSYAAQPLLVQVGCAAVMYLDLDEPRADAAQQQSDLRYDSRCGTDRPTLTLAPGAEAAGLATGPEVDAAGCAEAIRTSPLGVAATVPVEKGTVLCVLTSAIEAEDRGDRPRMVLVEVTDVDENGTAGLRATSWTVPE